MKNIIIGTRGSELALWQANFIKNHLARITSYPIHLAVIKTQGDKIDDLSFAQMEGKGFSLVEILSPCPSAWKLTPLQSVAWIEEKMIPVFPLGDLKDSSEE